MSYTIENIAQIIGARRIGELSATIDWLLTDSRSLSFPEETLFLLWQPNGMTEPVISAICMRAVSATLSLVKKGLKKRKRLVSPLPDLNLLVVPSPLKALQKLAEQHRDRFQIPVIGITGSNGKTVVKEWLHQLLSPERVITRSPRSYNSQIGVPLSVWQMNEQTELAILEAGISEPGEMRALQNIIKPTIGILTNIGRRTSGEFFSLQEKCMEKLALLRIAMS